MTVYKRSGWCAQDINGPTYMPCNNCPYGNDYCKYYRVYYSDAAKSINIRREKCGLPLLEVNDNDRKMGEMLAELREQPINHKKEPVLRDELLLILGGIVVSFVLAFPVAYLFPIITLFVEFIFEMIGVFLGTSEPFDNLAEPTSESFFYSDYWSRYFFCAGAMSTLWAFIGTSIDNVIVHAIKAIMLIALIVYAIFNLNIVVGLILGPPLIIFGLLLTAKR